MATLPSDIGKTILSGLIGGIVKYSAGQGLGWFIGAILGKGSDSQRILKELSTVEGQLRTVIADIQKLETELQIIGKELGFQIDADTIKSDISGIKATYAQAVDLSADDTIGARQILEASTAPEQIPSQLTAINDAIVPPPGSQSLIARLADLLATRITTGAGKWDPRNVGPSSPLATNYEPIENYFRYLFGIQLKGMILHINGLHARSPESDEAEKALERHLANLAAQGNVFIEAVEAYTLKYCYDLTLLGLMTGNHAKRLGAPGAVEVTDPIHRADRALADMNPREAATLRVRVWAGKGTSGAAIDHFRFDTGTLAAVAGKETTLSLKDPEGERAPIFDETDKRGTLIGFPAQFGARWALQRFTFRNLTKDVGVRILDPVLPNPVYNGYIGWRAFRRFTAEPIHFVFNTNLKDTTSSTSVHTDKDGRYAFTQLVGTAGYLPVSLTRAIGPEPPTVPAL